MLSLSNTILLVMAPEVASLRTTISALEVYDRLGIAPERVKIVLNNNSSNPAVKQAQLEKILKRMPDFILPFEPNEVKPCRELWKALHPEQARPANLSRA